MLNNSEVIIVPFLTAIGTQILKLAVDGIKGNLDLKHMWDSYGGMPSSHAAFVASLTTMVGFEAGWTSPVFALALVFAIVTIRDAAGFRREIGTHGQILNRLVKELPPEEAKTYQKLSERWGHSFSEIVVGSLIGVLVGVLAQLFLP